MPKICSVCVYCGSRSGDDPDFIHAAENLGQTLAEAGHQLVFGAGSIGLMGAVSREMIKNGGTVTGIIPHHLDTKEITQENMTETIRVNTMHERKKIMFDRSDAFVVLPGGLGTLDETFEVLTWTQLGLHEKPIMVLNVKGFWTPLYDFVWSMVDRGFVDEKTAKKLCFYDDIESVMQRLAHLSEVNPGESLSELF